MKRKPNRRQKPSIPYIPILVVVALLAGCIVFLFTTHRLVVRKVVVVGARSIDPAQIIAIANVPKGKNIFQFDLFHHKKIAKEILKAFPPIEIAHVGIGLPGTLFIYVQERQPYAVLHTHNGAFWEIDHNLVPFRQIDPATVKLQVINVEQELPNPIMGKPLPSDIRSDVLDASLLLDTLSSQNNTLLPQTDSVFVDQYSNLSLTLIDHFKIKLGQPDGLMEKLRTAERILNSDPELSQGIYLDCSSSRPAWMPRKQASTEPAIPAAP